MTNQQSPAANPSFLEQTIYWLYIESSQRLKVVGAYINLGWSVIPVRANKAPALDKWQCYQKDRPSLEDWACWLDGKPSNGVTPIGPIVGLGVVCGKVSGNLVVLDFDSAETWAEFSKRHGGLVEKGRVVKTGKGWHVYVITTDGPFPSRRLDGIDVISDGKYAVLPPSLHSNGETYHDVNPDWRRVGVTVEYLEGLLRPWGLKATDTADRPPDFAPIVALLRPHWEKGQRHELNLGLCGLLAKENWPWPLAQQLIRQLVTSLGDEEGVSRLKDLQTSYERFRLGEPVKSFKGLQELLAPPVLQELATLLARTPIPDRASQVDRLRLKNVPPFQRNKEILRYVKDELSKAGHFVRAPGPTLYWFGKSSRRLFNLESEEFKAVLELVFTLNPTEREAKYVLAGLQSAPRLRKRESRVYRTAYWNPKTGVLYVYDGEGGIWRLDGRELEAPTLVQGKPVSGNLVDNGSDEVLFLDAQPTKPIRPVFEDGHHLKHTLIDDVSFSEARVLRPEHQSLLVYLWFLSLFFFEALPARPILAVIAPKGAGKTFLLKRFKVFLEGEGANVDSVEDEDDFHTAIGSQHFLALDNVDERSGWLNDALAKAATGQVISRRKLYTTADVQEIRPRCFVALTARTPHFRRDDVADRLLVVRLDQRQGTFRPESELLMDVTGEARQRLWGALLAELNDDVAYLNRERWPRFSDFRMADWASLAGALAKRRGWGAEFAEAIDLMTREQTEFALEDDWLPPVLESWLETRDGNTKALTGRELYDELTKTAGSNGLDFFAKSARGLGQHIAYIQGSLEQAYGLRVGQRGKHGKTYQFRQGDPSGQRT